MASSKEQAVSRPVSGSFSRMSSSNRTHSNSLNLSATNNTHRVNRRKSVNASASSTAQAAIAAALRENGDMSLPIPTHRRSVGSKKNSESHSMSARPNMSSYFGPTTAIANSVEQDVVEDMSMDEEAGPDDKTSLKNRNRRASEGSHLLKGTSKKGELRCDTCGKGYKHSSCLTKHMWEHDPAWAVTSKLLISKHQQVQLLEAASVLCNMNVESTSDLPDLNITQIDYSEASSASPAYSGSSEMQDDNSSDGTTPPPITDDYHVPDSKRSSDNSGFSRSYRSAASSSFVESAISPGLPPQRFSGVDFRPTTSGTDDGNLAAATAGLTFGGTPKTRASMSSDIPPVPPLPEQYQSYSRSSNFSSMHNAFGLQPPSLTQQLSDERNHKADQEHRSERRSQLEEEGMFRMD